MLNLIFTLDYEVYGTGEGDFKSLMIDPTDQLISLFNAYEAKLTIMVEVAEVLALKRVREYNPIVKKIEDQLKGALAQGHDIQLHIHPAWFNACFKNGNWMLDFSEYSLVDLSKGRILEYIKECRAYLEELGKEILPDYRCIAYRAGNWLMQPSKVVVEVLEKQGFLFDTSVFKYGHGNVGRFTLDYRYAESELLGWIVDPEDVARSSTRAEGLKEIPILSRKVFVSSMFTLRRLMIQRRLLQGCKGSGASENSDSMGTGKSLGIRLFYPKKFDFCRLSYRELKQFVDYARGFEKAEHYPTPVVAIGHSTEFQDDGHLRKFLEYIRRDDQVGWTTFRELARENWIVAD